MSSKSIHQLHVATSGDFPVKILCFTHEYGEIQVEFCAKCGYPVYTMCEHTQNEWIDNEHLICKLCGADGT